MKHMLSGKDAGQKGRVFEIGGCWEAWALRFRATSCEIPALYAQPDPGFYRLAVVTGNLPEGSIANGRQAFIKQRTPMRSGLLLPVAVLTKPVRNGLVMFWQGHYRQMIHPLTSTIRSRPMGTGGCSVFSWFLGASEPATCPWPGQIRAKKNARLLRGAERRASRGLPSVVAAGGGWQGG